MRNHLRGSCTRGRFIPVVILRVRLRAEGLHVLWDSRARSRRFLRSSDTAAFRDSSLRSVVLETPDFPSRTDVTVTVCSSVKADVVTPLFANRRYAISYSVDIDGAVRKGRKLECPCRQRLRLFFRQHA